MKIQDRIQESEYIYLRETNGNAYQFAYHPQAILQSLLCQLFSPHAFKLLKFISQGKQLELKWSLAQNKLQPNTIIHLMPKQRPQQKRGYVYLNYDHKIHRLEFRSDEYIESFKWKVREQTGVAIHSQLILFNSVELKDENTIGEYEIRSGDFLCMAKNEPLQPILLESPRVIFPIKNNKKRSKSERQINIVSTPLNKPNNNVHFCKSVQNDDDQVFSNNFLNAAIDFGPSPQSQCSQISSFKYDVDKWMTQNSQLPTRQTLDSEEKQSKIVTKSTRKLDTTLSIVNEICQSKMEFEHLSSNSDAPETRETQLKQQILGENKFYQIENWSQK